MQIRLHPRHQECEGTGCQQLSAQFCRFLKLRQHCQKSAAGKNNSFPIHCSRSKHNCIFMKFLDFRTFGSRVSPVLCRSFFYFFNLLICKTIFDMLYYKPIRSRF